MYPCPLFTINFYLFLSVFSPFVIVSITTVVFLIFASFNKIEESNYCDCNVEGCFFFQLIAMMTDRKRLCV